MWRVLIIVLVVAGFVIAVTGTHRGNVVSAAVLEGSTSPFADFSETGTLVFYPNNVGPVPYLFYQDTAGKTTSKALTFTDGPPFNFSSWSGARISIVGHIAQEHVTVGSIAYVSAP